MAKRIMESSFSTRVLTKYAEKLAEKTSPTIVATILKEALRHGVEADLDLGIGFIKVRGRVSLRSPP